MLDNDILRYVLIAVTFAIFSWALIRFILDWKKDKRVYLRPQLRQRKPVPQKPLTVLSDDLKKEPQAPGIKPVVAATPKQEKDDLTVIEGIGAKIETLLNESGITTYKQLEDASVETVRTILDDAGKRFAMHNPQSWSKQAGLAQRGEWEALTKLQDELDGGR